MAKESNEPVVTDDEVLRLIEQVDQQYARYMELVQLSNLSASIATTEPEPPPEDLPPSLVIWPDD